MKKLKKFVEKFASAENAKNAKMKMIWNNFFDDDNDDFVKIDENEKTFYKFKKKDNFDDLNAAIEESDDYENIKYETNEKKDTEERQDCRKFHHYRWIKW